MIHSFFHEFAFLILETIYRSRLKIMPPQIIPISMEIQILLVNVKRAYPEARAAKMPVKNIVAPIPTYFAASVGVLFNKER